MSNENIVLSVRNLRTYFHTDQGVSKAVDDVSFDVPAGKTLAVVGESGCGKSVTALSILRLIPQPPGRIESGEILFGGRDLLKLSQPEMRRIRGNDISMIFQEPMTSMNPVFRVGQQLSAAMRLHRRISKEQARKEGIELLQRVGIPAPERRIDNYPHQMSGGMLQRVMIALALACNPKVLIADEPTTALDVTIQAQILELLKDLQRDTGMSIILITHDLGVVAETADEVVVMYAGQKAEQATVDDLFRKPQHPYTQGLFASLPGVLGPQEKLYNIRGSVPAATHFPPGCRFHPRCPYVMDHCREHVPPPFPVGENTLGALRVPHQAMCWLHDPEVVRKHDRPLGLPEEIPQE
ncbi:MAG: ABC transporter ATP-binding protein [Candidatus Hydrogenedentes bacterium]|nr:ABC transporter ATP-binding protein [Candidatus Hydrogenedentota bacterium]